MFSLNEACIPIAASLVASIRGKEDEKKMMEGFRHEKLNEAYGQALDELDDSNESTSSFGKCAETYTIIIAIMGDLSKSKVPSSLQNQLGGLFCKVCGSWT